MTGAVWVVVLTFNQWQATRACLQALYAAPPAQFNVLVVDNASTDETLTRVAREFPRVTVLANNANLGYTRGNNRGIAYALRRNAEFVALVNNDVIVASDWLDALLAAAREHPRAALLGPLVYHADEKNVIQSAGGLLTSDGRAYHRGMNETDVGNFSDDAQVEWLTGCAILARAAALRDIGLLDPSLFMYGEDVDWGIRARQRGYEVLFAPRARVWHAGVKRMYEPAPHVTYYSARNELRLLRKHRGRGSAYFKTLARHLRTLTAWTLLPRWRAQRAHRDALARALRDEWRDQSGSDKLGKPR